MKYLAMDEEYYNGPTENTVWYYDPETNTTTDDMGFIVYNVYDHLTPNEFYLFKINRDDVSFLSKNTGDFIDLIYKYWSDGG